MVTDDEYQVSGVPFEVYPVRMLVVLAFPEIDGKKRVALGPCQDEPRPLHHPEEEAMSYFGHVRHYCPPKEGSPACST